MGYSYIYPSFNIDIRQEWVVNIQPRPLYPRKRVPVQTVQYAGWVVRDVSKYLDQQQGSSPEPSSP